MIVELLEKRFVSNCSGGAAGNNNKQPKEPQDSLCPYTEFRSTKNETVVVKDREFFAAHKTQVNHMVPPLFHTVCSILYHSLSILGPLDRLHKAEPRDDVTEGQSSASPDHPIQASRFHLQSAPLQPSEEGTH